MTAASYTTPRGTTDPDESGNGGDCDEGLGDVGQLLVVPDQAAALHDPGESTFHDPAPADDDEALHPGHAPDDLGDDMGLILRPGDELLGVAAVRENALDEGKAALRSGEDALRPITVLNVGAVDLDREQPAVGVGQDMPLAPMDAFSGVIAFGSPF